LEGDRSHGEFEERLHSRLLFLLPFLLLPLLFLLILFFVNVKGFEILLHSMLPLKRVRTLGLPTPTIEPPIGLLL